MAHGSLCVCPIFVPHLGCPNDCTFCNQRKISGQQKNVTEEDVKNISLNDFEFQFIDSKEDKAEATEFIKLMCCFSEE